MPTRVTWVMGLAVVGVALAALAGVSWALSQRSSATPPVDTASTTETASSPAASADHSRLREQGFALFIAKGCVTCHGQGEAISRGYPTLTGAGPDLTDLPERFPPRPGSLDYLRRWLKDPPSVKPGTEMPNLDLGDGEIKRLLRFLLTEEHFSAARR